MVTPNAPIPGHHLLSEGAVFKRHKPFTTLANMHDNDGVEWSGGCQCGARPPEFPHVSMGAMKRWHREHKAELRGQATTPTEAGILMYVHDAGGGRIHGYIGRDEGEYPDNGWYRLVPAKEHPDHQLRGAGMEIEALKLRLALLGELVEGFDAWATHDDWCDGYSGGNPCSCGLDALRERARANATSVASPAEANVNSDETNPKGY